MTPEAIHHSHQNLVRVSAPNVSVWRGRAVNGVAPLLSIGVALFEATLSTYYFISKDDVWGGIHAAAGVMSGCVASCFTKYYFQLAWGQQAKSFTQLLGEEREIEEHLEIDLEKNERNATQMGQQAKRWQDIEEQYKERERKNSEKIQELTKSLEQAVEQLSKLTPLKESYDASITKTKEHTQAIKETNKELDKKVGNLRIEIGRLIDFAEELTRKIQDFNLEDATLTRDIMKLGELMVEHKSYVEKFAVEYTEMANDRDARERELEELKAERETLEQDVKSTEKMLERLREIKTEYMELITHLKELGTLPKRKVKRRVVK